ncbi:MAG: DUF1926 domain-containing protein [bacterium]|nr:DUF1926 domain-containing protein [bacterium]
MNKIHLALGIHNHQPVGNFDFVFEDSYRKSYKPFLDVLERHPRIRLAMHYSGILFEWILKHHPDYVERIRALVRDGRVEMITGGYYEPILPAIPDADRLGQIEKLTAFIRKHTGDKPSGMWCAERVWEPHLPKSMAAAGIRYSILDDAHFKYAGFEENDLHGHFVSEEDGDTVALFPINEKLRYFIPFKPPHETVDYLRRVAEGGPNRLVVFADDGEKFGVWPETHAHVYENGWLESFFRVLEENADWIEITHFREALDRLPSLGRVYIPTASYREMMHWALRTPGYRAYEDFENKVKEAGLYDRYHIFVRGGFWRNFLAKYPESNAMHKKMLAVSRKVWSLKKKLGPKKFKETLDHLWAGQCNCPYWHGVFGGLYLPHLRHANFRELIRAEALADSAAHSAKNWMDASETDFDGDGLVETVVSNPRVSLVLHARGGRVTEFDDRRSGVNLLNVMNRREEGYHHTLREMHFRQAARHEGEVASIHDLVKAKEEGLERLLVEDRIPHAGFTDFFLRPETDLEAFSRGAAEDAGDFADRIRSMKRKKRPDGAEILFTTDGTVRLADGPASVRIAKRFVIPAKGSGLTAAYTLETDREWPGPMRFGVELAFAFNSPNDPECACDVDGAAPEPPFVNGRGESENVSVLRMWDRRQGFMTASTVDRPAGLWRFPLETVSMSEGGFERVYQGTVCLWSWMVRLKPGEPFRVEVGWMVGAFK